MLFKLKQSSYQKKSRINSNLFNPPQNIADNRPARVSGLGIHPQDPVIIKLVVFDTALFEHNPMAQKIRKFPVTARNRVGKRDFNNMWLGNDDFIFWIPQGSGNLVNLSA